MKRTMVFLIVFGLVLSFLPNRGFGAQVVSTKYGDINGDGAVNSIDFALMRSYLMGSTSDFPVSNGQTAGDVNQDGSVNSIDFAYMRSFLLGLISVFPAGDTIPSTPTPTPKTMYQAEQATLYNAVLETINAGYTDSGYVNYNNEIGSYIEWNVSTANYGAYKLTFRYANGTSDNRTMSISVNGNVVWSDLDFYGTGNWTTWNENSVVVNLNQGTNYIKATANTANGGPNVDYLKVEATTQVVTTPTPAPVFKNVSVHDPSIMKSNGTYYVIGSHLASAKTTDLMQWQQISSSVSNSNPLIPNVYTELKESFDWAETTTMWAGDIIQLKDGKYYMYYCLCKGDSPRSTLGVAVSNYPEGPYKDLGIILKSGMWGEKSADGTVYDAVKHPNAVDPDVFYDKNGTLWMVYGSYSGGIYILKMDESTGKPFSGQGFGKKLLGANHSRIEAPCMMYSPESGYYYLFLSFGGLGADGGYNIRVCRSKNPDGPFLDSAGKSMINCYGAPGTIFDDASIAPYGAKLIGNFNFVDSGIGYVSPGHNSVFYDQSTNKYFNIFHTRFPGQGEAHEVRVHQMFINEDGWPVMAPQRYAGETIGKYSANQVSGEYAFVNHGTDITANVKSSVRVSLNSDGTISGNVSGKWQLSGDNKITLTISGVTYKGVIIQQWDAGLKKYVITFSALAKGGNVSIWGSHL